jgi:hypothetical protein
MWLATSWETLYISLLGNDDRLQPIPNNQLLGIVIKPRFGSEGEGVMILRKIFEQILILNWWIGTTQLKQNWFKESVQQNLVSG